MRSTALSLPAQRQPSRALASATAWGCRTASCTPTPAAALASPVPRDYSTVSDVIHAIAMNISSASFTKSRLRFAAVGAVEAGASSRFSLRQNLIACLSFGVWFGSREGTIAWFCPVCSNTCSRARFTCAVRHRSGHCSDHYCSQVCSSTQVSQKKTSRLYKLSVVWINGSWCFLSILSNFHSS